VVAEMDLKPMVQLVPLILVGVVVDRKEVKLAGEVEIVPGVLVVPA